MLVALFEGSGEKKDPEALKQAYREWMETQVQPKGKE